MFVFFKEHQPEDLRQHTYSRLDNTRQRQTYLLHMDIFHALVIKETHLMHYLKWVCIIKCIIKCVLIQTTSQRSETQDSTSSLFIILTFLNISVLSLFREIKSRQWIVLCIGMIEVPFTNKDQEVHQFKVWVIVGGNSKNNLTHSEFNAKIQIIYHPGF